ncbi:MAG: hypothetical protein IAF38_05015 [Bacteroidia bacterium]|nr:hypothetical protein [Bacteroidia bacterium]
MILLIVSILAYSLKAYFHFRYLKDCEDPSAESDLRILNFLWILLPFIVRNRKAEERLPELAAKAKLIIVLSIAYVLSFTALIIFYDFLEKFNIVHSA